MIVHSCYYVIVTLLFFFQTMVLTGDRNLRMLPDRLSVETQRHVCVTLRPRESLVCDYVQWHSSNTRMGPNASGEGLAI